MSNLILKSHINFKERKKPIAMEGRVCIDLTDPVTGKTVERVSGKNHIFSDSFFSGTAYDWTSSVSTSWMCLNTPTDTIDTSLPYLLGQTVGYGIPSLGTSGTYRGAYNSTNQSLAAMSTTSAKWKFQYDFTTAQANGTQIGTVGLTHQYAISNSYYKQNLSGFKVLSNLNYTLTCDGRYSYACSTSGIITKYDLWLGTNTTINVSSITGTTAASIKTVGYAIDTGKYYIWVYSSTPSLRKMYVFDDNAFSSATTTYSPTNIAFGASPYPLYIYGNTALIGASAATYNTFYYANFVTNVAYSTLTISTYNIASYNESTTTSNVRPDSAVPISTKHVMFGGANASSDSNNKTVIIDLSTLSAAGYSTSFYHHPSNKYCICNHPLTTEKLSCSTGDLQLSHRSALTAYKLASPITKTSANGMTATYELEVFWA